MVYDDNFEDEIDQFDEIPVSEETIKFDGLEKAAAKAERRRKRRRLRNERTGKIAACVLLICVIVAIITAVVMEKETEHFLYGESRDTLSPTQSPTTKPPTIRATAEPTVAPKPTYSVFTDSPVGPPTPPPVSAPTLAPTKTMAPTAVMQNMYFYEPMADTTLHLNGAHASKIFGRETTLSVQRGNKESTLPGQEVTLPAIVSLLQFDLTSLPKRNRWPAEADEVVKMGLRLQHIPKDSPEDTHDEVSIEDILPVTVEVYRLPNNHEMIIESLSGEGFQQVPRSVQEGILVGQQVIKPDAGTVDINVSPALFLPEDAQNYDDDWMLLKLKVYWEEEAHQRDMFKSRESDLQAPQLVFFNMDQ